MNAENYPKCRTCRHWILPESYSATDQYIYPLHPNQCLGDDEHSEVQTVSMGLPLVRECNRPLFHQRPLANELAVVDGSTYYGKLITGESFGCLLHSELETDQQKGEG